MNDFTSGFVAIAGRPNSGKSTLINSLIGKKVALSADFPQTTRKRGEFVLNLPSCQAILTDTPGIGKPRTLLGQRLNDGALRAVKSADMAIFLSPASEPIGKGDRRIVANLHSLLSKRKGGVSEWSIPVVALVSKADESAQMAKEKAEGIKAMANFTKVMAISCFTHYHIEDLKELIASLLPAGPQLYGPEDAGMDEMDLASQIVRGAFLPLLRDELPHSLVVRAQKLEGLRLIFTVYVESESQKGIVIGRGGSVLAKVKGAALPQLKGLFGAKTSMRFDVKVAKNWQRDPKKLDFFGY